VNSKWCPFTYQTTAHLTSRELKCLVNRNTRRYVPTSLVISRVRAANIVRRHCGDSIQEQRAVGGRQWRRNEFESVVTGPEQKWRGTVPVGFGRAPPRFGSERTIVVLVSAFVMVSTVWSVYCLMFFYSRCPQCTAICKNRGGGTYT